ncbi:MAG: FIG007808: hypothetical protein, partial [uncultured Nocardioides sp.]
VAQDHVAAGRRPRPAATVGALVPVLAARGCRPPPSRPGRAGAREADVDVDRAARVGRVWPGGHGGGRAGRVRALRAGGVAPRRPGHAQLAALARRGRAGDRVGGAELPAGRHRPAPGPRRRARPRRARPRGVGGVRRHPRADRRVRPARRVPRRRRVRHPASPPDHAPAADGAAHGDLLEGRGRAGPGPAVGRRTSRAHEGGPTDRLGPGRLGRSSHRHGSGHVRAGPIRQM